MIDTHCHLTFPGLYERVDQVLSDAKQAGVDRMICVGTGPDVSRASVGLAERYDNVFATVGVHPHEAARVNDQGMVREMYNQFQGHQRVVALGEIGLDWHYPDPPRADQVKLLETQLQIVAESELPIVIHNREATDDLMPMLRGSGIAGSRFVFHCFTGTDAELDTILDFGAMVSFTGVVTFKNAQGLADAATRIPLERVMIETDSPYLAPEPHRKVRPNEPKFVADVARFLAKRREMSLGDFVAAVDKNAERFFGLAVR